jgi:hypothetical protein
VDVFTQTPSSATAKIHKVWQADERTPAGVTTMIGASFDRHDELVMRSKKIGFRKGELK